jgi:hypothetical protein
MDNKNTFVNVYINDIKIYLYIYITTLTSKRLQHAKRRASKNQKSLTD